MTWSEYLFLSKSNKTGLVPVSRPVEQTLLALKIVGKRVQKSVQKLNPQKRKQKSDFKEGKVE